MSIVIAVANKSRVVVKSDGLSSYAETGKVKSEDFEKILNLNNDCIIGFTGINENCELVLSEYKRLAMESNIDIGTLKPTTVIYDLCELTKVINNNDSNISFVVAGRENDRIVLFAFSSGEGYEINNFTPIDDKHIKYVTIGSEYCKTTTYSKYYSADKSFESTMNNYIRYISSVDQNVNDHIFTRKVK
ncbi:MAG: hypothetical protein K0S61_4512 [Anaerocolumna sp.]|nr:hypothetical protein [Anaerocolumna sp.]